MFENFEDAVLVYVGAEEIAVRVVGNGGGNVLFHFRQSVFESGAIAAEFHKLPVNNAVARAQNTFERYAQMLDKLR